MVNLFVDTFVTFFFLLTPFFLLSTFLSMTREMDESSKRKLAVKTTLSVIIICIILFIIGSKLFEVFGITLNSFRIGTGVLLFLSAISLVQGNDNEPSRNTSEDIAVVPLAIPVAVGPATTGALLVMGGGLTGLSQIAVAISAIAAAVLSVGFFLLISSLIERVIKKQGLTILSKITGLVLAAMAAQMIMKGILGFMERGG